MAREIERGTQGEAGSERGREREKERERECDKVAMGEYERQGERGDREIGIRLNKRHLLSFPLQDVPNLVT